ncbi:Tr-type G domain-containing protein [Abortiporus biennis]
MLLRAQRSARNYISIQVQAIKCARFHAAACLHDPSKIRNMALVAHIDSGKTTLTESILLKSSYLSAAGSVDTGSTTTDFLPAERARGITIQSASIPVKWKKWTFNLIDTPGHADFGMEVESASRVVDGAVVLIDSVEGVEAQTKGVWRQLDRYGVKSRIMFMNKLDRAGASFHSSVVSLLANRLHPKPMVLTLPVASFNSVDYTHGEPGVQGLVDLVNWELWKFNGDQDPTRHPLPRNVDELAASDFLPQDHPIRPHLLPARTALLDNLSMFSDDLMDTLLELPSDPSAYLSVAASSIMPHLRNATLRNDILPVLCGSAFKHIGTELVMDYVGELLPSPADVVKSVPAPHAPLRMLAWKVGWDKRKGWMTFVRVYSGTMNQQSTILNATRNQREKVSKLLLLYADQTEEVQSLTFGSVGVILGCRYTRTGDTLVGIQHSASHSEALQDIVPPPAVMSTSVIPQSHSDQQPVQDALYALARTDPSVRIETHEGQVLVHGLGALHLEIVESRLRDEWNVNFEFGKRRVSYREGLGPNIVDPAPSCWKTEVAGRPLDIFVNYEIKPLDEGEEGDPVWDDNIVFKKDGKPLPSPESLSPTDPWASIGRGIANSLSSSPHTSLPLSKLHIKVKNYQILPDFPVSLLTGASASLLRDWLKAAGMGPVMEPYIRLKIAVSEEMLGKVVKDITENGGEVLDLASDNVSGGEEGDEVVPYSQDGVYVPPALLSPSGSNVGKDDSHLSMKRSIHAIAPLSQMLDFSNRLRALSGGNGTFEMVNAGFKRVSESRKMEILREIGRA